MKAPATYQACLEQEQELVLEEFTAEKALELGLVVLDVARELTAKPIAVHIDNLLHPLFTHFMDGTGPVNWDWVGKKRRVVREFGHSSWAVGLDFRERGLDFAAETGLDPERYRAEGGALALHLAGGHCVGSLTVSGLQGFEDHAVAVEGLRRWLGR